ncbi:MAG: DUF4388 domain-containing protein [Nannocystaceae bacterium]|nr:DUF4388 domain-containing protein [Nannocystaceae bacterium]
MPKGVDIVTIGDDGSVTPEGNEARYRLRSNHGRFRIMSDTPGLLILRRLLPDEEAGDDLDDLEGLLTGESGSIESGGRVMLAGEILSPMTLFQMVEVVAERGFQGDMQVFGADGRWFSLSLDQGALLLAHSNHPDDRLGELMVRESLIDREWLDVLLGDVSETSRLGEVCLERGVLDREQLFVLLQKQTSEIFLRMLLVGDGSYVFTTPDPGRNEPPRHTVHIPVRALLMDGIRRLDEIELYRQLIPGNDVCLLARASARLADLDTDATTLLMQCDGSKTLEEMARLANLDEFAATRAAYFLVKRHAAEVSSRSHLDETEIRRVCEAFTEILRDVFAAVQTAGGLEPAKQMLSAWVEGSGYASFLGERVGSDGSIDTDVVLDALRASREDDPVASLHHIGHELVAFSLFCAGSALTREQEMALSKDVNRRLQLIRAT